MRPTRPGLPRAALTALAATGLALAAACSGDDPPGEAVTSPPVSTASAPAAAPAPVSGPPQVDGVVADGFTSPWGLAFLPDGTALVSERDTAVIKRVGTDGSVTEVGEIPGVEPQGEGGLLGIAFRDNWLYVYFTGADDNRIVRLPYTEGRLGEPEVLLDGIPAAGRHNGGRLAFGPDGMLYAGTGDAGNEPYSQDPESLGGKILRMTSDGSVPADNPFPGSYVWSLGHRNVQGLAFDDQQRLWASEFGQNTFDELNRIEAGANYGWPEVEGAGGAPEFVDPLATWPTHQASPSGVAVLGAAVFMAGLRGETLWQIPIAAEGAGQPNPLFTGQYGRLRTVEVAPDGSLWLVTSNTDGRGAPRDGDDKILRLTT
jgi:aldose sugar dehydrogenase